jgi:transposase InsO family protein
MDFITGLPRTQKGYDSIWVIVGLHGVPKKIVSDQGSQFTSRFWRSFHENTNTKLNFITAYHPQTDGQTERTNQVLEEMLRACDLQHGSSWDKSLPYAEFSYNNSYQASLKMSPFETLYGRKYKAPLYWIRLEEDSSLDLNLFKR